jgi:hypothetical protein
MTTSIEGQDYLIKLAWFSPPRELPKLSPLECRLARARVEIIEEFRLTLNFGAPQ